MSPKVRLDLMVGEATKSFLQRFAAERGVSMSEMVDQLIIEHLMHEAGGDAAAGKPCDAVFDALEVTELRERVSYAISHGLVMSEREYFGGGHSDEERAEVHERGIVFIPSDAGYAMIAAGFAEDELHSDIYCTYGGDGRGAVLSTVDAYLSWYEDADGFHLHGLRLTPKGASPSSFDSKGWEAPAEWPKEKPEPWWDGVNFNAPRGGRGGSSE